jgi:hypothetical protein
MRFYICSVCRPLSASVCVCVCVCVQVGVVGGGGVYVACAKAKVRSSACFSICRHLIHFAQYSFFVVVVVANFTFATHYHHPKHREYFCGQNVLGSQEEILQEGFKKVIKEGMCQIERFHLID